MEDDKYYLQPGFDPKSLKVSQLRGILNQYNVIYPSNMKKPQLIDVFNVEIAAHSDRLLQDYQNAILNKNDIGFIDVNGGTKKKVKKEVVDVKTPLIGSPNPIVPEGDDEKSPFTNDNVFQSPNSTFEQSINTSSSVTKKSKKRKNEDSDQIESSPQEKVTTKKTKKVKKNKESIVDASSSSATPLSSPKVKSTTPKAKSATPKPKSKLPKSIFDDAEDDIVLGIDTKLPSSPKIDTPPTAPKVKTPKSKTPTTTASSTPKIKSASKSSTPKVTKPASTKKQSKKLSSSPLIPPPVNTTTPSIDLSKSFQTVEEELEDFDKQLKSIKNRTSPLQPAILNDNDLELAKSLGITIEGLPSSNADISAHFSDIASPSPKKSSIPGLSKSALTPKPRLLPEFSLEKKDNEDEDEDEEEVEIDEVEKEDELIKKLEASIEQEEEFIPKPSKKTRIIKSLKSLIISFSLWIILISSGLFAYWYYQQLFLIGYCGQEIQQQTFPNHDNYFIQILGDYLDSNLKPTCKPCPLHARCFPLLEIGCYEDFIEFQPWDNFLKPYNKVCVPDSKKAEKLEIMIEVAIDLLRSKNINTKCGQNENIFESGIKTDDLHDLLLSMKAPYITNEEFEELWSRAKVELEKDSEIIVRQVLKCQLQNTLTLTIFHYKYEILILVLIFSLIKFSQFQYQQYKLNLIKIDIIYQEVLKKLQYQKRSSNLLDNVNPYIGSNQLRDLILINEKNLTTKLNLWNVIQRKIEINSNVSIDLIEDNGEIIKVWKWISDI
ncbi:spliced mRNA and cell cycle regulated protein [Scheffersomyces coipomensis]|uniref:spliced mRNA and cell cycle regulated protein n=1 Tax=Scheffersomyces coipomensis TaxID=1788519 RepID=UPI00315CA338